MDPPFEHVDLAVLHRVGVHAEASPSQRADCLSNKEKSGEKK